jgi:hypothetical protein
MTLTIGMRELDTEHLQSGVANTASALVAPQSPFDTWHMLAALAAGYAFPLTLRARLRVTA